MTKAHTPAHYQDGFVRVAFCNVCGAEGLRLLDDCQEKVIHTFSVDDFSNKAIDPTKRTAK